MVKRSITKFFTDFKTRIRHLKPSKHVKKNYVLQVKCNYRLKKKITKFTVFQKKIRSVFVFVR